VRESHGTEVKGLLDETLRSAGVEKVLLGEVRGKSSEKGALFTGMTEGST